MVKLNNSTICWIIKQVTSGKRTTKDISEIYNVTQRWIQILVKKYKVTGIYPVMNKNRRPKTYLTDEQKELIDMGFKETFFGATMLRHHIFYKYGKRIPQNKMHKYMLEKCYAKENKKKQKKRKRCRYERKHSLSLLHTDWTEYKNKQVIAYQDDASRKIFSLMEFERVNSRNSIKALEKARKSLGELAQFIRAINTDRGTQFYPNKKDKKGNAKHDFRDHLKSLGIQHIPSKINNPQTNGKMERWFQEYKKHRGKFKTAEEFRIWFNNRIHGALNYRRGETPEKAFIRKMNPSFWIGLNFEKIGL